MTETNILSTVSKTYTTQEMANKLYANAVQEGQDAADQAEKNAKADTDTKLLNYSTTLEMNSAIKQAADSISLEVSKTYTTTVQVEEKYKDAVKPGRRQQPTLKQMPRKPDRLRQIRQKRTQKQIQIQS